MSFPWAQLEPSLAAWGVALDEGQRGALERYLALIAEANRVTNLTAEDSPEDLLLRHAADGLAAVPLLRRLCPGAPRLLDLGAGAGFIGFSIKIAWPEADVWLMESLQRKYDVLNKTAVAVGLKGLHPVRARAAAGGAARTYDAVVERALAPLPEALLLAMPMLEPGGRFVAYQSAPPEPREASLEKALARSGAKLLESFSYRLPREPRERCLAVFEKAGARR